MAKNKTALRKYVEALDDEEKRLILNGFEAMEESGVTDSGPLGVHTEAFIDETRIPGGVSQFLIYANFMAMECYRYFAELYLKEHNL